MGTIEAAGFSPLRAERLHELLELDRLGDIDMMRELEMARLDPSAPSPSVESLLHALLPHRAVQHSHADVIITLTNLADGEDVVRSVYGDDVVIVPYVMPGFDLARAVRERWPADAHAGTVGMVLLNHGLFTFGDDSFEAYRRHARPDQPGRAVARSRGARRVRRAATLPTSRRCRSTELATLRRAISDAAGAPMIVQRHTDPAVGRFVARADLADLADPRTAHPRSRHPHQAGADGRSRRRQLRRPTTGATSTTTAAGPAPSSRRSTRPRGSCSIPSWAC